MSTSAPLEARMAVVERDVDHITNYFDKLDNAVEKLVDVSSSLKEMLAVHEQKLTTHDQNSKELYSLNEERIADIANLRKEVKDDMDSMKTEIVDSINSLRGDLKEFRENSVKQNSALDRLKWYMMAGGIVIIFILSKLKIIPFAFPLQLLNM